MSPSRGDSVSHSTWGHTDVNRIGFPSQVFWGLAFPVQIPRSLGLRCFMWGNNPLPLWEKHLPGKMPPYCVSLCWGWGNFARLQCLYLQPISTLSFYPLLWRAVHLALRSFSEGNNSYVAVGSVCPREEVVQDLPATPSWNFPDTSSIMLPTQLTCSVPFRDRQ